MAPPTKFPLENYRLIKMVFLLGDDGDRRGLQVFGLSVARFNALTHLAERGPLTATDLCLALLCDKANITRLLNGLEGEQLVKRTPDKTDGRRTCVTLTPAGQKRWAEANQAYQASIQKRFGCLSLEEETLLHKLLSQLKTSLKGQLP